MPTAWRNKAFQSLEKVIGFALIMLTMHWLVGTEDAQVWWKRHQAIKRSEKRTDFPSFLQSSFTPSVINPGAHLYTSCHSLTLSSFTIQATHAHSSTFTFTVTYSCRHLFILQTLTKDMSCVQLHGTGETNGPSPSPKGAHSLAGNQILKLRTTIRYVTYHGKML